MRNQTDKIIREAIERGVQRKAALLREAGGLLSANEVANLLRISGEELLCRKSLLTISLDDNALGWPAFQFESRAMVDAVERVLQAINVEAPWAQLGFFFLRLQELDGRTPIQAIRDGSLDAVVLAAHHYGYHGAS